MLLPRTMVVLCFFAFAKLASGVVIPGVYSTGVNNLGNLVAPGTADSHYTLLSEPDGSPTVALVATPDIYYNEPNGPTSSWISPNADDNQNLPVGYYDYLSTVDLTGFNPATVVLTGEAYVDDNVTISVNGVTQAYASSFYPTPFTLSGAFQPGVNTIDYLVYNDYVTPQPGGVTPSALRIDISGTGSVPEPSSVFALVISMPLVIRRKR
jgi:hypothetical protein